MTVKGDEVKSNFIYHTQSIENTVQYYNTNLKQGLTQEEAAIRLKKYGKNVIAGGPKVSAIKILLGHIFTFMNIVLVAAMVLSFVVQEWIDGAVLVFILFINVVIGFIQDYRSEKTMEALQKMTQPQCRVVRDGQVVQIASTDIVPGDIVHIKQGDSIPADLRLFSSVHMECDEALLTGESLPVEKSIDVIDKADAPLGDRHNMAFMNSTVQKGKGKGIVVASGMKTQLGKIAKSLNKAGKKQSTRLELGMKILGIVLVIAAIVCLGLTLFGAGVHKSMPVFPDAFKSGITTAIAIVPEGLIPIITLTMALGIRNMAKQKAIVRKMNALEALGNITNICTDKTGTLTEGKMVVTDMYIGLEQYLVYGSGLTPVGDIVHMQSHKVVAEKPAALMSALTVAALCNTASITQNEQATSDNDKWVAVGEPTELALQVLATKAGVIKSQLEKELEFNAEFAFDSTIKRMSVVYKQGEQFHVFSKGAPEKMLELCSNIVVDKDGNTEPLNDDYVTDLLSMNEEFAKNGLRVLCLAYSKVSQVSNKREDIETQLTCIGFVGIKDPPRKEVYEAIQICREAGITVHMATGDQSTTAVAIAKQVGIIQLGEEHLVMTAAEFDKLTDEELKEMKELPVVIARCSPQSKVRLVKALHARKKHVAMTGDGVNDAPAIKNADVGIAMGKSGTDVTKQASDIVLTDDSFDTIITAIREGRRTFANMRKFVVHLLAGNVAETIALVITVLAGLMPSLYPTQVLWLNLVTGIPVAMGLGMERAPRRIMHKEKRPLTESLFTLDAIVDIFVYGSMMGVITIINDLLVTKLWLMRSEKTAKAVCFATLTVLLLFHGYNCRHSYRPFFRGRLWKSWMLHLSMLLGIGSLCFALYVPWINTMVFKHAPLNWDELLFAICGLAVFILMSETYKLLKRLKIRIMRIVMHSKRKTRKNDPSKPITIEV